MRENSQKPPLLDALMCHYDELVHHVRKRFGDKSFAQEVVHEVYVQLTRTNPSEQIGTPLALLKHISTCKAIDLQRANTSRNLWQESVAAVPDTKTHTTDGEEMLRGKQLVDSIQSVVSNLPSRCKEVFILHKIEDMSQQEVALQLGISRKMVVKHMERAMSSIRPIWNETPLEAIANTGSAPTAAANVFVPDDVIPRSTVKRSKIEKLSRAVAMLCVVSFVTWLTDPVYQSQKISTGIGETSTVTLADGSRIYLNTDSEIIVESHLFSRQFTLHRGEAGFDVAHTFRRFVVKANRTVVTDIGTIFDVRNLQDGATVKVVQGAVKVRSDEGETMLLTTNQAVNSIAGKLQPLADIAPEKSSAWRRGKLYFDGTPLRDAVQDMQRYRVKPITLSSDQVGNLRLSGEYNTHEIEDLLSTLPTILPVTVQRRLDATIISKSK